MTQEVTIEEFQDAMRAQDVPMAQVKFECPMCGTHQSATDLIESGVGQSFDDVEKYLAFSCVGRWIEGSPSGLAVEEKSPLNNGCDWTLGGLFPICDLVVVTPDGEKHPRFRPVGLARPADGGEV